MGCRHSKIQHAVRPVRSKYALRIATHTNEDGQTASSAVLYYHGRPVDYDAYCHDTEKHPVGLLAYRLGLEIAMKVTATEILLQTHHLDLLNMLEDPEFRDETTRSLESHFKYINRRFIYQSFNDDAMALCQYESETKIEPNYT